MSRVYRILFVFFLFVITINNIYSRSILTPAVDSWLWEAYTFQYPLSFYKEDRYDLFCWNIGATFLNRNSFQSWVKSIDCINNNPQIQDLSALFHGVDNFYLFDLIPEDLSNNENNKYYKDYFIQPSYTLDQSSCNINIQVSRDWKFCDKYEIRTSFRCIVPFIKESVINNNSAQMYFNQTTQNREEKNILINKVLDSLDKNNIKSIFNKEKLGSRSSSRYVPPMKYVETKSEGINNVFAIRCSYFPISANNILMPQYIIYKQGDLASDYNQNFVCFNKFINSNDYSVLGADGNSIIETMVNGGNLITNGSTILENRVITGASTGGNYGTVSTNDGSKAVSNESTDNLSPNAAYISIYSYFPYSTDNNNAKIFINDINTGNTSQDINNQILWPLTVTPANIVANTGDNIVEKEDGVYICYGVGENAGSINTNAVTKDSILRIIATGSCSNEPYNIPEVNFNYPPVIIQKSLTKDLNGYWNFPETFGKKINLPNQQYLSNSYVTQFDQYNPSGDVTLLKPDGTFLNPNANTAVLWYGWDYYSLFHDGIKAETVDMDQLFMTSSLYTNNLSETVATPASVAIDLKTSDENQCCISLQEQINYLTEMVESLEGQVFLNNFSIDQVITPQLAEIWAELNVQGVLTGTRLGGNNQPETPTRENKSRNVLEKINDLESLNKKINDIKNFKSKSYISKNASNQYVFVNGIEKTMQYNEFQQNGLGDILLEFYLGSYFLNDSIVADLILGLQLPSSQVINGTDSYLAIPIGNNGHYAGKFGYQMIYDFETLIRMRFTSRGYLEYAFKAIEQIVPGIYNSAIKQNMPVFGMIPVKMDTSISWGSGLFYIDGSFFTNDYTGFTVGYQYWKKGQDKMQMISPTEVYLSSIQTNCNVNIEGTKNISQRSSHTISGSIFSRITNECQISCGVSNTVAGINSAKILDIFATLEIDY